MRSYTLSKKDSKKISEAILEKWPSPPDLKAKSIRIVDIDDDRHLLIIDGLTAIKYRDDILPFLQPEGQLEPFPKVIVDVGAVRYICNGADVMRPGVAGFEGEFKPGGIAAVKEAGHGRVIAVGLAAVDISDARSMSKGMVVKNLHYVGDKFWEAYKTLS